MYEPIIDYNREKALQDISDYKTYAEGMHKLGSINICNAQIEVINNTLKESIDKNYIQLDSEEYKQIKQYINRLEDIACKQNLDYDSVDNFYITADRCHEMIKNLSISNKEIGEKYD